MKIYIVDAFTDTQFKGNPAGVCVLDKELSVIEMQNIAAELNLSETAFIAQSDSQDSYTVSYFTPTSEIDFCGHATLASAKVIQEHYSNSKTILFKTFYGLEIDCAFETSLIQMTFPLYDYHDFSVDEGFLTTLGINETTSLVYSELLNMILVHVPLKETLINLQPDFEKMKTFHSNIKGVIVTTKSDDNTYDFYSRCFFPWLGINEDPVTGSAHCILAKYWHNQLQKKQMHALQISKRSGSMHLDILKNNVLQVSAQAVIVIEGNLDI